MRKSTIVCLSFFYLFLPSCKSGSGDDSKVIISDQGKDFVQGYCEQLNGCEFLGDEKFDEQFSSFPGNNMGECIEIVTDEVSEMENVCSGYYDIQQDFSALEDCLASLSCSELEEFLLCGKEGSCKCAKEQRSMRERADSCLVVRKSNIDLTAPCSDSPVVGKDVFFVSESDSDICDDGWCVSYSCAQPRCARECEITDNDPDYYIAVIRYEDNRIFRVRVIEVLPGEDKNKKIDAVEQWWPSYNKEPEAVARGNCPDNYICQKQEIGAYNGRMFCLNALAYVGIDTANSLPEDFQEECSMY